MRRFAIPTRPWDEEKLYPRKDVTFWPGHLTVLVGCNGSGKSTLMMFVKDQLRKDKSVLVLSYNDRHDGGQNLMDAFAFHDKMDCFVTMAFESEGERIMDGVSNFAASIRGRIQKHQPKELWILLDAVGSGLSIDGIHEIKKFARLVIDDNPDIDVYFVVSTNEYEFADGEACIDVTTFTHRRFKSYKSYKNFILRTYQKKLKRREEWRRKENEQHNVPCKRPGKQWRT